MTTKRDMSDVTTETHTPYGTIYRSGDREWFGGSVEELRTAKAWEWYRSAPGIAQRARDDADDERARAYYAARAAEVVK